MKTTREDTGFGKKSWTALAASMALVLSSTNIALAFDDFPVGARPAAFSGAFTALGDDINSLYYNPAALATLSRPQATAYYAKLLPSLSDGTDAATTFMAYGQQLRPDRNWGAVGVGWTEFRLQDLFQERTLIAGYGTTLPWMGLSVGANAKILSRSFGENADTLNAFSGVNPSNRLGVSDPVFNGGKSAQKTSFDLGALAQPLPNMSVGASFANINTPDLGLSSPDRVPMVVRLGAAYQFPFLNATMDLTRRRYLQQEPDNRALVGFERGWLFNRYGEVTVRGGAGIGSRAWRQISMGFGYEVNGIGLDYVFVMPLGSFTDMGNTHQISLSFRFGKAPGDQELDSLIQTEKEATVRAEEALKLAQAEAQFVKEDRNQMLAEVERLKAQVEAMKGGVAPLPVSTPAADKANTAVSRERAARDKAQREFNAAYQAAMAAYGKKVQRGATLVDRTGLLQGILDKYQDKDVDVSRTRTELERVKSDLAQAESDYHITWDFYKKTVADGADTNERISLLERMSKKYGRAGIDISEVKKELDDLKKK